jgi:hypothetical protein
MSELRITISDTGMMKLFVDGDQIGLVADLVVRHNSERRMPSVEIQFPKSVIAQSEKLTEAHGRYLELLRKIPAVVLVDCEEPAGADSPLVLYFLGTGTDGAGRTLSQVMSKDDSWHERTHDHIQWMLPTRRRSQHEPGAPVLTDADVQTFRARRDLRETYSFAVDRFKKFLRLDQMCPPWVRPRDHNHKRITRLLESLRDLGFEERAARVLEQVLRIDVMNKGVIDRESVDYWKKALAR